MEKSKASGEGSDGLEGNRKVGGRSERTRIEQVPLELSPRKEGGSQEIGATRQKDGLEASVLKNGKDVKEKPQATRSPERSGSEAIPDGKLGLDEKVDVTREVVRSEAGRKKVDGIREKLDATREEEKSLVILLLGRTGQGKSHLGNKLLEVVEDPNGHSCSVLPVEKAEKDLCAPDKELALPSPADYKPEYFTTARGPLPCTRTTKVLSRREPNVTIIDTPGFASNTTLHDLGVYRANLALFRNLIKERRTTESRVNRVVYFLPVRGVLERADGVLQEELKVMHHFFGNTIFASMVVVATFAKKHQRYPFTEEDIQETTESLEVSLKSAIPKDTPACPPVIFIGLSEDGERIRKKIESARVQSKEGLLLNAFVDGTCAKCACKFAFLSDEIKETDSKRLVRQVTENNTDEEVPYGESMCHPRLVSEYYLSKRVQDKPVLCYIVPTVLGVANRYADRFSFLNFDKEETCVNCHKPPGSRGCLPIGQPFSYRDSHQPEKVNHSNSVDTIACQEDIDIS